MSTPATLDQQSQVPAAESGEDYDAGFRSREEMTMLIYGFLLGVSIGGIFVIYIVLAYAGVLN